MKTILCIIGFATALLSGSAAGESDRPDERNHYILCDAKCAAAGWSLAGSLHSARWNHTATLLLDGKVLVAGGSDDNGSVLTSAELYDPATDTWTVTGRMSSPRAGHFAFLLSSGAVLVIGGDQPCCLNNKTAEIYSPDTGVWSPNGVQGPHFGLFSATMLPSGNIFLAGVVPGRAGLYEAASYFYDVQRQVWVRTSGPLSYRQEPSMALLTDGTVLVAGGSRDSDEGLISPGAEVYSPATDTWNSTMSPRTPRLHGTSTLLADGGVLTTGGFTSTDLDSGPALRTSEVYGADRAWHPAGDLNDARMYHTATLLSDGRVLVAGGFASSTWTALMSAEVYNAVAAAWTNAGSLNVARLGHTATLLDDGRVLVVGGVGGNSPGGSAVLRSAEIYHP